MFNEANYCIVGIFGSSDLMVGFTQAFWTFYINRIKSQPNLHNWSYIFSIFLVALSRALSVMLILMALSGALSVMLMCVMGCDCLDTGNVCAPTL